MAKTGDDLEAVRAVVAALSGFSPEDQERVIRWAREKLGLPSAPHSVTDIRVPQPPSSVRVSLPMEAPSPTGPGASKDLKAFVEAKQPKSDTQFAATVAYFYRFEAPSAQRADEIDSSTLQDACRLAGRNRLNKPAQTLRNAKHQGLLDSGGEAGKFSLNTVGENLVAMTLPSQTDDSAKGKRQQKQKSRSKKTSRNKK